MRKKLEIESQKIKAKLILAEKRLEMEKKDREEKLRVEAEKTAEESKRLTIQIQLDNEFRHSESTYI